MVTISEKALNGCLKMLLRPVIRFCLNRSLGLRDLTEMAKVVFVEVAADEMEANDEEISISRISMMTGVHRKDATRIHREGEELDANTRIPTRVVGQWKHHKDFTSPSGRPRVLSFKGEESEFTQLVQLVSKEIRPAAVLFELERVGVVERTKNGLKLVASSLRLDSHSVEGYQMLAEDVEDLMDAVLDNFDSDEKPLPNIHVKTEYDNIDESDIEKVRKWFASQCFRLHQRAEKMLTELDLDLNPDKKKKGGRRVVLGSFTHTTEE
ncbi:MAG: hypothetical protein KDD55_04885 [Bdellovibrionales bacterium]|nr:hypothetical protein [Bdellovibrionales bacterium]